MGYCNWSSASSASALTFTCGRTWKVFHVSFPNLFCMLLMTTSRTSSIMAEKKFKMADLLDFSPFTSIIWPCGRDNLKSFSRILFKFVMHLLMTSSRTSSIMAEKKKKWPYCDFSHFTSIFDLVGAITWKVFHISFSNLLCMLLMTSSRTSSIMAEKKGWFIAIFHNLRQ